MTPIHVCFDYDHHAPNRQVRKGTWQEIQTIAVTAANDLLDVDNSTYFVLSFGEEVTGPILANANGSCDSDASEIQVISTSTSGEMRRPRFCTKTLKHFLDADVSLPCHGSRSLSRKASLPKCNSCSEGDPPFRYTYIEPFRSSVYSYFIGIVENFR